MNVCMCVCTCVYICMHIIIPVHTIKINVFSTIFENEILE